MIYCMFVVLMSDQSLFVICILFSFCLFIFACVYVHPCLPIQVSIALYFKLVATSLIKMKFLFVLIIFCYSFESSSEIVLDNEYMRFTGYYIYSVINGKGGGDNCWTRAIGDIKKECLDVTDQDRTIIWVLFITVWHLAFIFDCRNETRGNC